MSFCIIHKRLLGNSCVPGTVLGAGDLKVNMTSPHPRNSIEKGDFPSV